ncbi:hypothetical protein ACFLVX_05025 [Chloroflexota bacterium]
MEAHTIAVYTIAISTASVLLFGIGKVITYLEEYLKNSYEDLKMTKHPGFMSKIETIYLFNELSFFDRCGSRIKRFWHLTILGCIASYVLGIVGFIILLVKDVLSNAISIIYAVSIVEFLAIISITASFVVAINVLFLYRCLTHPHRGYHL